MPSIRWPDNDGYIFVEEEFGAEDDPYGNGIDEELLFDFEYYDERWDCQLQTAQMDIYIPIKKLEG